MIFEIHHLIQIAFVCMSLALIGFGVQALYQDSKSLRNWNRRLGAHTTIVPGPTQIRQQEHNAQGWKALLNRFGSRIKPSKEQEISKTRSLLLQAGYRHPNAVNIFYGIKVGLMVLLPGVSVLIMFGTLMGSNTIRASVFLYLYVFATATVGTFAPNMWLRMLITRRQEQIGRGFPDALDLLVLCLESGLGLDAALYRVASDIELTHPLLSQELKLLMDTIRSGQSHQIAFTELNQRVNLEDVHSFTALVLQTEKLGVSITQAMKRISEAMRTKRQIQAEEKAAKLPVKLLFPVTIFMFPSIIAVTMLPGVLHLVQALSEVE